jgi:hypothetical protein
MALSFKDYLTEEDKIAYFTFGRMNPPTIGHEKLLDKLSATAGKNQYFVFLSQTQDKKKNPLDYNSKVKHVRKMFPRHARRIMINKKVRTPFEAASYIYEQGYKTLYMVVGSDRVREFETLLNKYNGEKGRHGFYNFKTIKVVSAGERDPDSEGVEGMSASKLRGFAADNQFAQFSQGLGSMGTKDAKKLFVDVRSGLGIKEETVFSRHIELEPVSETREKFVKGELFELGDQVIVKESDEVGTITHLGANYLIVQLSEDKVVRKWLDAVEKIEEACWSGYRQQGMKKKGGKQVPNCVPETNSVPSSAEFIPSPTGGKRSATLKVEKDDNTKVDQDSDIKDREGSQPKKYHKGLSKATKQRRDAQFKKQSKMSDRDPKAYKPAAGDKTAKTKPSKYTKSFKKMFGDK